MAWFELTITYILLWWLVFFMSLPFGVKRQEDGPAGSDAGAPERPLLLVKLIVTTLVTAALTAAVHWFVQSGFITIRP